jgi:hypothetical protein
MEFLIDLRFEDPGYNAMIHFLSTFTAKDTHEAQHFYDELIASFKRKKVILLPSSYIRIDNNPELRESTYEYHEFYKTRATASIQIEQFFVSSPDQSKTLWNNLIKKFLEGEDSVAKIGRTYDIPVRASDINTRNPISGEFYYFSIEHLIPKNQ